MGRERVTSRADAERKAALAAGRSLKGVSDNETSSVATPAKRHGDDLVNLKKKLPLQKRVCTEKVGHDDEESEIQYVGTSRFNKKQFCDKLKYICSHNGNTHIGYFDWLTLGRTIGYNYKAVPSHCTFASGWWDSPVTESPQQQVDVNPSSSTLRDNKQDEQVVVPALSLQQASTTVATNPTTKKKILN